MPVQVPIVKSATMRVVPVVEAVVLVVVLVVGAAIAPAALSGPGVAAASDCWRPPVDGRVVDPFRPPSCPWCPGNRGLEYLVAPTAAVRAVAAGVVTFAGAVAGVRYVVVATANGERVTYGRLTEVGVAAGDDVGAGHRLGTASGVFFLGLRDGEVYVDPQPRLGRLVARPRLVPLDGSPARPAPPTELRCPAAADGATRNGGSVVHQAM